MSMTHTIAGGAVLLVMMQGVWELVGSIMPPPPAIVVNSLEYDAGFIIQDRRVNADGKFTAAWTAAIVRADTGEPVCEGSGVWDYASGEKVVRISVPEWTGDPDCRSLPAGHYYPFATYQGGEFYTDFRGGVFEVTE